MAREAWPECINYIAARSIVPIILLSICCPFYLLSGHHNLHQNFQLTLETTDNKNSLQFLDMLINIQQKCTIF